MLRPTARHSRVRGNPNVSRQPCRGVPCGRPGLTPGACSGGGLGRGRGIAAQIASPATQQLPVAAWTPLPCQGRGQGVGPPYSPSPHDGEGAGVMGQSRTTPGTIRAALALQRVRPAAPPPRSRNDRQYHARWPRGVVKDGLPSRDQGRLGVVVPAGIVVAVEVREVAARNVDLQPVARAGRDCWSG